MTTTWLVALAETCGKNGHAEEGLDLVAQGLAGGEQTGQRLAEAELYRLRGELLMIKDPGNVVEGERSLRTAIDVARRQGARLFELRTTVSVARLLRDTNRRDEARAMLAEIYGWFTEGFDTADLRDAKALLDELSVKSRDSRSTRRIVLDQDVMSLEWNETSSMGMYICMHS
jgi:predicted ATPase